MANQLLLLSALLWAIAAIVALCRLTVLSAVLLVAGTLSGIAGAVFGLPGPAETVAHSYSTRGRGAHISDGA